MTAASRAHSLLSSSLSALPPVSSSSSSSPVAPITSTSFSTAPLLSLSQSSPSSLPQPISSPLDSTVLLASAEVATGSQVSTDSAKESTIPDDYVRFCFGASKSHLLRNKAAVRAKLDLNSEYEPSPAEDYTCRFYSSFKSFKNRRQNRKNVCFPLPLCSLNKEDWFSKFLRFQNLSPPSELSSKTIQQLNNTKASLVEKYHSSGDSIPQFEVDELLKKREFTVDLEAEVANIISGIAKFENERSNIVYSNFSQFFCSFIILVFSL